LWCERSLAAPGRADNGASSIFGANDQEIFPFDCSMLGWTDGTDPRGILIDTRQESP